MLLAQRYKVKHQLQHPAPWAAPLFLFGVVWQVQCLACLVPLAEQDARIYANLRRATRLIHTFRVLVANLLCKLGAAMHTCSVLNRR